MSDVAVTWAKAQTCLTAAGKADRNAKQVLVHMASYADAAGEAWVLVGVLALEMDVEERTVQRGKQALLKAGLLIETGATRVHRGRRVPMYRLPLELGHASTVRRINAEREAGLATGDTGVTRGAAAGCHPCHPTPDARVTPMGDTGVTQIGKGNNKDKTHRERASVGEPDSSSGVGSSAAFDRSLAAWAAKAPERASRPLAWAAWIAATERTGLSEAALSAAVLVAVVRDADFGRGKAMNFHRWLTEGRFEPWLVVEGRCTPSGLASAWDGPADVRCAVVQALGGEAAAVSYLDPATWDGGRRVVLAAGRTAADRLRRDAGRALRALGVGVEVRISDNSSERVRA